MIGLVIPWFSASLSSGHIYEPTWVAASVNFASRCTEIGSATLKHQGKGAGKTGGREGHRLADLPGLRYFPGWLDREAQQRMLEIIRGVIAQAPLFVPEMPRTGRPFSVRMTNCGPLGWVSDRHGGYRYQPHHPKTGTPWPKMPQPLLELWRQLADYPAEPEACLVNYYAPGARMGLHQDSDEADMAAPVVSLSLGDTALFRIGGTIRRAPTRSLRLYSGDVIVLGGAARTIYHGVDRILAGSSQLLAEGGRFNLTLRRVTRPE